MVRDGFFYGLGLGAVAVVLWRLNMPDWLVALPIVLAAFFLWFFRDPNRTIPQGAGQVVSPGDGVVTEAEWIETISGSRLRLSIFFDVFDVHVKRGPWGGRVAGELQADCWSVGAAYCLQFEGGRSSGARAAYRPDQIRFAAGRSNPCGGEP